MQVVTYTSDMSPDLASSYNRLVHNLPYCYPITPGDFDAAAFVADGETSHRGVVHDAVFVAVDNSRPLGFLHVAIAPDPEDEDGPLGLTRFFWYERGHRAAGRALLTQAEGHARAHGADRMTVFHHDYRYPIYHMRYAWGSDRLEHVHALLHHNGYSRPNGEIYLEWPDYEPTAAGAIDVGFDLSVEWEEGAGRLDNLRLKARRDGEIIGECHGDSCGEWSRADAAQARMYTTWLGVETDFEGKGLGTHLLRRALQEAQAAGYRHAVISTNQYNYRARTLYPNFGYKPTDWTYRMDRELDTTSEG